MLKVAGGGAEHITIRQLLNMSSGFFDYQEDSDFVNEQQLFGPLGMSHTSFPDRSSSAVPEPHARGYYFATDKQ